MVEKLKVRKLTLNKVHPNSAVEQMRMCRKFLETNPYLVTKFLHFSLDSFNKSCSAENMKLPYMKKAMKT